MNICKRRSSILAMIRAELMEMMVIEMALGEPDASGRRQQHRRPI
ncbi:MAG: hypothetical protein M5U34_31385 [Chloroflexi bacterium]|nr:hypothetical protein [Chloroflexota bacterium]